MQPFDIIIVGGGLVGSILALTLSKQPLKIALIEATASTLPLSPANKMPAPPTAPWPLPLMKPADTRFFALNYYNCQFLHRLGLWDSLAAEPIDAIHVSRAGLLGALRLHRDRLGLPALGYVMPAANLEVIVRQQLDHASNLTRYQPATLVTLRQQTAHEVQLEIATPTGNKLLHPSAVIGAEGTHSLIRQQLGLPVEAIDYQQTAMVTSVTLRQPHQQIAYERFNEIGILAMLPLTEKSYAVIWSGETKKIEPLSQLTDEELLQKIQAVIGYRLGKLVTVSPRFLFPLQLIYTKAHPLTAPVLLIGNAAHTFPPMAAQGFNLALYEIAIIATFLHHANLHPQPSGQWQDWLRQIHEQFASQQTTSRRFSDYLARHCTGESFLKKILGQLGILGLEKIPFLQQSLLKHLLPHHQDVAYH